MAQTIELEDWEIEELKRIIITAECALAARIETLEEAGDSFPENGNLIPGLRLRIAHGNKLWRKLAEVVSQPVCQSK